MKNIKFLIYIGLTVSFINCSNMKNQDNGGGGKEESKPKEFASSNEAAAAAKNDMLAAMDQNVNFGVDKEKLRTSSPGTAINRNTIDMNALLTSDTTTTFDKISRNDGANLVPFVNGTEVIAVIGLKNEKNTYTITGLGDNFLSSELNIIYALNEKMQGTITIMEIANLNATIYEIRGVNGSMYHTSYNGHNLRQEMTSVELIKNLKADAQVFERKYGDKLKKQKLVH